MYQHSILIEKDRCRGCVACMHSCPMRAIRVRDGKALILDDRCIDCGVCILACPEHAIVPLTTSYADLGRFKHTIAIPSPVLYGQFGRGILPNRILLALKQVGFDQVYDEAWTCEIVSAAVQLYAKDNPRARPLISPTCPVVVRLIQLKFPGLVDHIIPIETPREIAARELKQRVCERLKFDDAEVGVIYITPCSAKMIAINDPPTKRRSHLDGAVSIADIYGQLLAVMPTVGEVSDELVLQQSSGVGIGWAASGGEISGLEMDGCLAVTGVQNVIDVLEDLDTGKLRDVAYLECRACELGCIGGQLAVENRYISHRKIQGLVRMFGEQSRVNLEQVKALYRSGYFSFEKRVFPTPIRPLADKPTEAIELIKNKMEILRSLKGINCGACGAPDCATFAEDVVTGQVALEACVFKKLEALEKGDGSARVK